MTNYTRCMKCLLNKISVSGDREQCDSFNGAREQNVAHVNAKNMPILSRHIFSAHNRYFSGKWFIAKPTLILETKSIKMKNWCFFPGLEFVPRK